jgi:CRISPR-associated endonuclease/helicase Cas3
VKTFTQLFEGLTGKAPFPWQSALFEQLLAGGMPRALDLPTGLGKTSVMAIWLLARAAGAPLSRRLVYVVDRRAVVDQATTVAEELRAFVQRTPSLQAALGLGERTLPISTLRGELIDNREWLDDPSVPAIVVGTVDMIGSRLLFEGYGVSRKMRPYHAGFLGADTLIVLDEAHLVRPFELLVDAVANARIRGLGPHPDVATLVPSLRLLSLSATGRRTSESFTLTPSDHANEVVRARVGARKLIEIRPAVASAELAERLAEAAHELGTRAAAPLRIVVFCDTRTDAGKVADSLRKLAGKHEPRLELFVGGRRAYERTKLAGWLHDHGFVAGKRRPTTTAFLIATSAGEVGVDLDADAAVCDVVAWERMVQRLGRVNRRGVDPDDGTTPVTAPVVFIPIAGTERSPAIRAATLALFDKLPRVEGALDGSPNALGVLRRRAATEPDVERLLEEATTPAPLHPPLERAIVDAWAMTSLEAHTGRPEVAPWLRGWLEDEEPQVAISFRDALPIGADAKPLAPKALEAFLDVAGPHAAEELETEVRRALDWLASRADVFVGAQERAGLIHADRAPIALAIDRSDATRVVTRSGLTDKRERERLERHLAGGRLVTDARVGGLTGGLLDAKAPLPASEDGSLDVTQRDDSGVPFRVRRVGRLEDTETSGLRLDKSFMVASNDEGDPTEWLVVERRGGDPISESGRSIARRAQGLAEHQAWVEDEARAIANRLALDDGLARALRIAGRLHDEGKKADCWQRAFHVPVGKRPLAKNTRAPNVKALGGYRHELGSLQWVERDGEFATLDENLRDLVLHLVAAHHGRARPVLTTAGAEENPSKLRQRARDVALRYDRMARRFGPWGLAWLESLLRAADVRASRKNDEVRRG